MSTSVSSEILNTMARTPGFEPDWADTPPASLEEDELLELSEGPAREQALALPLNVRFRLRAELTPIQLAFLDHHGFAVFDRVSSKAEVHTILAELEDIGDRLIADGIQKVRGVPVWHGIGPGGDPMLERMGFSSVHSPYLSAFVQDLRFDPVRRLIGEDARIGHEEKDGVVFNRYVSGIGSLRPTIGWHTDSLRDVFYNRRVPGPMLNVGLHLDRIRPGDGGLFLIPGTHTQSALSTLFRKIQFVSNQPDRNEIHVETWPGDLTVHDGRMWHRVQAPTKPGWDGMRRNIYVPYVCDDYQPKSEDSQTPLYQRLFDRILARRLGKKRKQLGLD
ncbi:MAG: phytanoyl-CoA hydroxylase [Myxococcota bacterium]|jgi:phytanoyl-CoA hydroxylase